MVNMNQTCRETDVVIVGGGPAGLAASIAMRRKGLQVVVADRGRPPIDKVCGEGLMPDGVAALAGLGVTIPPDRSVPFRGIRFVAVERSTDAVFHRESAWAFAGRRSMKSWRSTPVMRVLPSLGAPR